MPRLHRNELVSPGLPGEVVQMTITSSKSSHSAVMFGLLDGEEGVEHERAPRREESGAGEHQNGTSLSGLVCAVAQ